MYNMITKQPCHKCNTGKISFQIALLNTGEQVKDWHKCSNIKCDNNSFAFDGIKGDKTALQNVKHYYKINSYTEILQ